MNFVAGQSFSRTAFNLPAVSKDIDVPGTMPLASQMFTLSDTWGNTFLSQGHNMPQRSLRHEAAGSSIPKGPNEFSGCTSNFIFTPTGLKNKC